MMQLKCYAAEKNCGTVKGMPEAKEGLRVITVTGGKGGTGKSLFTVNLAVCLQELGYRVLILDADFGFSNIDIMLGLTTEYNFSHVLNRSRSLKDIIKEGPRGIKFISGGSGLYELTRISADQLNQFFYELSFLEQMFDILLIDTGAGASEIIQKLVLSSNETILVATPEPTSIMDAYALLKNIRHIPKSRSPKFHILVNKAETEKEAQAVMENFSETALRFLQMRVEMLGCILSDETATKSIKLQAPLMVEFPKSAAAKGIRAIAGQLMNQPSETVQVSSLVRFFKRMAWARKGLEGRTGS